MMRVLVLHGPNLNLLGLRETDKYGVETLDSVNAKLIRRGDELGVDLSFFQSSYEGALIDRIHTALAQGVDLIVFNPAGYTHTSVALRDALLAVSIPFVEIHITDPSERESFRHHSYFSDIALDVIKGKGTDGYMKALESGVRSITVCRP